MPDPIQLKSKATGAGEFRRQRWMYELTLFRYLIDAIVLSPSAVRGSHSITTVPVNAGANADAKALLRYLGRIYGKQILSGQQDQVSLDWVIQNVGKTPAILGLDFMGM